MTAKAIVIAPMLVTQSRNINLSMRVWILVLIQNMTDRLTGATRRREPTSMLMTNHWSVSWLITMFDPPRTIWVSFHENWGVELSKLLDKSVQFSWNISGL